MRLNQHLSLFFYKKYNELLDFKKIAESNFQKMNELISEKIKIICNLERDLNEEKDKVYLFFLMSQ